ncbi:hypothetical protein C0992_003127 [Termitomyces sp. T32_za158]|nr:hypothetical protein C0992_003127 [Termitomyces sp. T32_za158]
MDFASLWARRTERSSGIRPEVRSLEEKVARVAAKKCSVEEVAALYRELDEWLESGAYAQTSLLLSSALLRAILLNHQAHSEANRNIKIVEANLRAKIDELQLNNEKLETELRRTQASVVRPYTPAPVHSLRSMTQTPGHLRTTTPAPPPIPTKPRRLSTPSTPAPPKMVRSPSDEKAELRQIWIPPGSNDPPLRTPSRSATRTPYTTASSRFSPR